MMIAFRSMVHLVFACFLLAGMLPQSVKAADEDTASTESAHKEDTPAKDVEAGTAPHDVKDHAKGGGDMEFKRDLALWSLVTFVVFVFVLRTFAWGPLVTGLDNREAHFRSQLVEAEAARLQAEKMLKEHAAKLDAVQDEVKAIIEEARRDAEHTKNDIIQTAQKEAKATQDRAIHEIERSRDAALKELFDTLSSQVASATEHVIGRSLDGDDQNRLIDEALSQFSR